MAVLREHVSGLPTSSIVIAVAREEFESWLIADETSAGQVLGRPLSRAPDPESLGAREAKRTLADWMESIAPGARKEVRCLIARTCDLDVVAQRCAAFQAFLDALRDVALS
jgi:hypothetical protein